MVAVGQAVVQFGRDELGGEDDLRLRQLLPRIAALPELAGKRIFLYGKGEAARGPPAE